MLCLDYRGLISRNTVIVITIRFLRYLYAIIYSDTIRHLNAISVVSSKVIIARNGTSCSVMISLDVYRS